MESEVPLNAADVGNIIQICVCLLIAQNREQDSIKEFSFIFSENLLGSREKRHIDGELSFLSVGNNP